MRRPRLLDSDRARLNVKSMKEFIESSQKSDVDKAFNAYKLGPNLKERPNYKLKAKNLIHNKFAQKLCKFENRFPSHVSVLSHDNVLADAGEYFAGTGSMNSDEDPIIMDKSLVSNLNTASGDLNNEGSSPPAIR